MKLFNEIYWPVYTTFSLSDIFSQAIDIITNFFNNWLAFIGYLFISLKEMLYNLFITAITKLIVFTMQLTKIALEIGWDVTKEFIINANLASRIFVYYGQIPADTRAIIEYLQIHTCINIVVTATIYRFILSYIPFSGKK